MSTAASARRARTSRPSAHLPFVVALLAGVAVRVVVMVAYRPALLFPDSFSYLRHAHHFQLPHMRPAGYSLVLWPIAQLTHSLTPVSAIQHAAGIALAIALYVFLLRRGLPAWGATLATLPVLLDPLQLVLEHYVLSDFLFEVALVAACLTLLWRHRPGHLAMLVTGVLAASTGIVRGAGSAILVAFLVAVLCLRVRWTKVAVFVVGAALPLVPYVMAFHAAFGSYGISDDGPRFLYARIAPKVSCPGLDLPRYERPLCPKQSVSKRPDTDYFMWGGHHAPQWHVVPPPGMTQVEVVKDFDKRVIRAEPRRYARAVLVDLGGGFAPVRTYDVPGYPASYWLFAKHYWSMDRWLHHPTLGREPALKHTSVDPAAARFLTAYRHRLWTPGPLLGLLLVLAAVATAGFGRARRCGDRVAIGLLAAACFLPILTGAAVSGFSWRYQLPQLPLLPATGALAVAALVRGRAPGTPPPSPGLRPFDRAAERLARSLPVAMRRRVRPGPLAVALGLLTAALTGAVAALLALASGWVAPVTAAIGGLSVAVLVAVVALVSMARSPTPEAHGDGPGASRPEGSPDVLLTGR